MLSYGKFEIVAQKYISQKSYKASVLRVYRNSSNVYKVESFQNTNSIKDNHTSNQRFLQISHEIVNEMIQYERLFKRKQHEALLEQIKRKTGYKESLSEKL
jgi:transposase